MVAAQAPLYAQEIAPYIGHILDLYGQLSVTYIEFSEEIFLTLKGDLLRPFSKLFKSLAQSECALDPFIQPLVEAVIPDAEAFPIAFVPQAVHLFTRILLSRRASVDPFVRMIDERLFAPLLAMLSSDPGDFLALHIAFTGSMRLLARAPHPTLNLERIIDALLLGCCHLHDRVRMEGICGIDELFGLRHRQVSSAEWTDFCDHFAIPVLEIALKVACDLRMKPTFMHSIFLVLTLLQLPVVARRLGDVAHILAEIFPARSPHEIEELTMRMMRSCKEEFVEFMIDMIVSTNEVSPNDPHLNRRDADQVFEEMNQAKQQEPVLGDALAMEIALFSLKHGAERPFVVSVV
jgi:hypothetical protein